MKTKYNYFQILIIGFILLIMSGLSSAANIDTSISNKHNMILVSDRECLPTLVNKRWRSVELVTDGPTNHWAICVYEDNLTTGIPSTIKLCPRSGPWQRHNEDWVCGGTPGDKCVFTTALKC